MTSEIRANTLKNRVGLGTISFTNTGTIVSGIVTANSFSGPISGTTGTFSGNVDINGDLDVDGHTNLDNVSIAGVTTATGAMNVGNILTVTRSGSNTAALFSGGGGAGSIQIKDGDDGTLAIIAVDGGYLHFSTSGSSYSKKLTIKPDGKVGVGIDNPNQPVSIAGRVSIDVNNDYYGVWADGNTQGENHISVGRWYNTGGGLKSGYSQYGINNLILENNHPTANHCIVIQPNGQKVAIGTHVTDGLVHIGQHSAGTVSADADADELVLESSGNTGLSILSPGSGESSIYFGNPGTNGQKDAWIKYYHETHSTTANRRALTFRTSGGERLRIASNGKIHVKGNGGDSTTDFSDEGTFLNLKHDTYGGRIGFSNGTASSGVALAELFGYWGSNKVTGWVMNAGGDATNRDDGQMSFYTRKSGEAVKERFHIGNEGQIVAGYRVGTSTVRSNQPVAFQSARVTPDTASSTLSDGVRCNLYVGSNTGWQAGDGGVIGMGGSRAGYANQEAMWGYIKGSRQSGNGWEYAGKLELGTAEWGTYNTTKAMTIFADNQVRLHGDDSVMMTFDIGGATRLVIEHTGGGNMRLRNNSAATVTYSTSSDYRLKENVVGISSALTTVKALKPYEYKWKHDGKLGQGFFAHEAQEVLPDVGIVSGTKDEVQTEDDTKHDGQWKKDDPIYQSIDYSKLVPLLTAALQEETAKREALEARVAALESS